MRLLLAHYWNVTSDRAGNQLGNSWKDEIELRGYSWIIQDRNLNTLKGGRLYKGIPMNPWNTLKSYDRIFYQTVCGVKYSKRPYIVEMQPQTT